MELQNMGYIDTQLTEFQNMKSIYNLRRETCATQQNWFQQVQLSIGVTMTTAIINTKNTTSTLVTRPV
jgi:hypothetical protein